MAEPKKVEAVFDWKSGANHFRLTTTREHGNTKHIVEMRCTDARGGYRWDQCDWDQCDSFRDGHTNGREDQHKCVLVDALRAALAEVAKRDEVIKNLYETTNA